MLHTVLSRHHKEFQEKVRKFAHEEVAPKSQKEVAPQVDKEGKLQEVAPLLAFDIFKRLAELSLLGIPIPEKYGGAGLDTLSYAIAVEEVGSVCGSTGIFLAAHTSLGCYPIYIAGDEEQKQKWLIPLAKGEKIGSFGLTEPNAGSDASATETTAKLVGNKYVINGTKRFITSGGIADIIIFTATQDRSKGVLGISAFVVEKGTHGFSAGKEEDKLGLRGSVTSELIFEDCAIPHENLLGKEGDGFKIFMQTLDGGRISIGALALGIAQGALDACVKYVQESKSSNKPLYKSQFVQGRIADIATEVEAARALVYNAAILKDTGELYTKEAAMAKLYASEVAMRVTTMAVELHGIMGLTKRYPVERFMRDAKLMEIGEGTSEIQRVVIAREILGK